MNDKTKVIVTVCACLIGVVLLVIGGWKIIFGATGIELILGAGGLLLILASLVAWQNDRIVGAKMRKVLWAYIGILGSQAGYHLALQVGYYPQYAIDVVIYFPLTILLGLVIGIIAGALVHSMLQQVVSGWKVGILASTCAVVMASIAGYAILAVMGERWNYVRDILPEGCPPDCQRISMSHASLKGIKLRRADLSDANLVGADLREADLRKASLKMAKLVQADLRGANLRGANLSYAHLTGAWLHGADLREADLTEAVLSGAVMDEADLRNATVTDGQLDRAASLSGATLPDGTAHE